MAIPSFNTEQAAEQITRDVANWIPGWIADWGTPLSMTYGFRSSAPMFYPSMAVGGFQHFNPAQILTTEYALSLWADVANVSFTRIGSGTSGDAAYTDTANFLFANFTTGAWVNTVGGLGYWQFWYPGPERFSQVWMNGTRAGLTNPSSLDNSLNLYLHEIGHGLGLSHPGSYDRTNGGTITYANNAEYMEDTKQYTVMSYFSETNTGANFGGLGPMTPMIHDIAAIQQLYGENLTTRVGNTIYGFNSNTNVPSYSMTLQTDLRVFAIWDAGGFDTIDFSKYSTACTIDLAPGSFSSAGGLLDNISIAFGVTIECAIGGSGNDTLIGNAANNILNGGLGTDTMRGGPGDDTYVVNATADKALENPNEGVDTVQSSVTYTLPVNVENLILIGISAINGTGNALANAITGNGANNILAGLAGADALDGGDGIDTATYAASTAGVNVSLQTGTGTGGAAEGDTLIQIENLTGSNFNDMLEGNGGNNVLKGGSGIDTLSYEHATAGVTVSLALTSAQNTIGAGTDTVSTFENLTGSQHDDTLTGSSAANVLMGLDGNDTLNGGAGIDTMIGGDGNDIYFVANLGDTVDETGTSGIDTVNASITFSLADALHAKGDIENLTLTGTGAINGTGNALANIITGNSGNNVLAGLGGADTLVGGLGTDTATYAASAAGVSVSLMVGAGNAGDAEGDTLSGIENLTGSNADDALEGDGGNNVLVGGLGNDVVSYVSALAGVTVSLALTSAQNTIGAGTDRLSGFENITGSSFNDTLTGTTGNNVLDGYSGNDTLIGGAGADSLLGGSGSDSFVFKALADSTPTTPDFILDFESGLDQINLSTIDANTAISGNQAFAFVAGSNANVLANSVTWYEDNGVTVVQADVNGNATADLKIVLQGINLNLHATDFIL